MKRHTYQEVGGQCMGECRLCGNIREASIHGPIDQLDVDSAVETNAIRRRVNVFRLENRMPVVLYPVRLPDGTDVMEGTITK